MALTHEKAYALAKIINADNKRAKILLALDPNEATKQINALGHNFAVEEIREYGSIIRAYMGDCKDKHLLDGISGGIMLDSVADKLLSDKIKW